jgi:hypothetical protein
MGKDQTVPFGTDFRLDLFQAIPRPRDAWLRSFGPSGTKVSFLMLTQMRGLASDARAPRRWPKYGKHLPACILRCAFSRGLLQDHL